MDRAAQGTSWQQAIALRGENSLKCVSRVPEQPKPDHWTWGEIGEAFTHHKFTGFTLLRLGNEC